jgi:hypothetical protein
MKHKYGIVGASGVGSDPRNRYCKRKTVNSRKYFWKKLKSSLGKMIRSDLTLKIARAL